MREMRQKTNFAPREDVLLVQPNAHLLENGLQLIDWVHAVGIRHYHHAVWELCSKSLGILAATENEALRLFVARIDEVGQIDGQVDIRTAPPGKGVVVKIAEVLAQFTEPRSLLARETQNGK